MERPTGVTVIAILGLIGAGLLALLGVLICLGGTLFSHMTYARWGMVAGIGAVTVGVVLLGLAALYAITSIGLLKLQNRARVLAVVLTSVTLMLALLGLGDAAMHLGMMFFFGMFVRRLIVIGIDVWILVYLFQPHVKKAFGAGGA
jgi:hypothetical protein